GVVGEAVRVLSPQGAAAPAITAAVTAATAPATVTAAAFRAINLVIGAPFARFAAMTGSAGICCLAARGNAIDRAAGLSTPPGSMGPGPAEGLRPLVLATR